MDSQEQEVLVDTVLALITRLAPGAVKRAMYGGTVFELEEGTAKSRIGGVYAYDSYVSVEFAKGASFGDPIGVLEGSGKLRRHVKLHAPSDIDGKGVEGLLSQAIKTYQTSPNA